MTTWWAPPGDAVPFDESTAAALIGKHILIGLTYVDQTGNVIEQKQIHGDIVRASRADGIVVVLASGEQFALPPALDSIQPANPGKYRLRGTGEVVIDPDFTATYTITRPTQH